MQHIKPPHLAYVELQFSNVSLHRANLLLKRGERRGTWLVISVFPKHAFKQHSKQYFFSFTYNISSHLHKSYLIQVIVEGLKEKKHRLNRRACIVIIF